VIALPGGLARCGDNYANKIKVLIVSTILRRWHGYLLADASFLVSAPGFHHGQFDTAF
jgi:hypothetical protein